MTLNEAIVALALVLRAENDALAVGDAAAATRLLPEKQAAVAALRAAAPTGPPELAVVGDLRELVRENGDRLALAIEVQGRILELVGRAARQVQQHSQSGARGYGRRGNVSGGGEPVALAVRA